MVTIYIENRPYTVKPDQNLLQACLSLGFNVPYFCWHPAMHSVGACRQCAVKEFKDEKDTRGRIVMSCMTPVKDGLRISIEDPEARAFRKSIIELLMLNHPHDCPVCDEGGECHLQDMTVMTGHVYRRTRFKKRTHRNQYLGPFITHEMNRCIQCYRCVRFYRDYAGGRDFNVFAAHDHVYFGRAREGVLENEFSGNLAEVCPTGVFTDKTLQKHYTRKWDLQNGPSVCVHCSVGCNTIPGERYGELRRIRTRYNGEVNGYFLCDRGRFGYEFVNSEKRVRTAAIRRSAGAAERVSKDTALAAIKEMLSRSSGIIGIGSPRASLEANFALREMVGGENFHAGMAEQEQKLVFLIAEILRKGPARVPSLSEIESCDAVLVLGEDVTNTAPLLALSLRQAARSKARDEARTMRLPLWDDAAVRNATQGVKGLFTIASPYGTRLEEVASRIYHGSPDNIARLGFAVAHELNGNVPAPAGLDQTIISAAASIADELRNAKRPLVVSGTACGSEAVIRAAANIASALCSRERTANIVLAVPECNTLGLALMGGRSLGNAFRSVQDGKTDTVIVLENDLYRRADENSVDQLFAAARNVICIDHLETRTAAASHALLPAAAFAEADGTLVNYEGRAQRFYQVFVPSGDIQESWRWLRDLMTASGSASSWKGLDDITADLVAAMPLFAPVADIAPPAGFRIAGMKIPRQPHRASGRTAMYADKTVFEPRPPKDDDSPLAFTMEGFQGEPPSPLISHFWAPGWNSPQAINKFQIEVGGPLRGGDPGKRLIEPASTGAVSFFPEVSEAPELSPGMLLFVPAFHIFGSEEMSALAPGIAELAPKPYLGLSREAAEAIGLRGGDEATVTLDGIVLTLPVREVKGIPSGTAVLPAGLSGIASVFLPLLGSIVRGRQPERKP